MDQETQNLNRKRFGRRILIGVVVAATFVLLLTVYQVDRHPRTDDANVWANFIEIAPEVSGRLVQLPVKDNAFVKTGGLLFVIDPRPYEYALQQALADQELLEQQIIPLYYDRDRDGLPREWIARMKRAIRTLGWRFSADRMVMDYVLQAYIPAAGGTSSDMTRF